MGEENYRDERKQLLTERCQPDMNYVSAVYGVVVFVITVDWLVRGKRNYRGQVARHEGTVVLTEQIIR